MKIKNLSISAKILIVVFVLGFSFLSTNAPRAKALFGAGDIVHDPINYIVNAVTSAFAPTTAAATVAGTGTSVAQLSWDTYGKTMLDYAAYSAAQQLLTQLSNNTIKWIQGGFHGSPSFAVDTRAVFTDIADNVAGGLVLSLKNISVCNFSATYKDDLANAVSLSVAKRPYIYSQKAACPFNENYGFKASDFYSGVSQFSWNAFGSALDDSGNPYGLQALTVQEQAAREAEAKATKAQQLSWSNGFTNIVDPASCNYPSDIFYAAGDPNPKSVWYDNAKNGIPFPQGTSQSQIDAAYLSQEEANQLNAEVMSDPSRAKAMQDAYCKTTTPGKIVGDQLTKTLGLDMDRLGFADNMNKIVAAFLDTVTQKTIRGVFGAGNSSVSTHNTAGYGAGTTPIVAVTAGSVSSGLQPVSNITSNGVTLNGYITYAGSEAKVRVWFVVGDTQYSVTPLTGSYVTTQGAYNTVPPNGMPVPVSIPINTVGQSFSKTITGLDPNTVYWVSVNAATTQTVPQSNLHSLPVSFRTLP